MKIPFLFFRSVTLLVLVLLGLPGCQGTIPNWHRTAPTEAEPAPMTAASQAPTALSSPAKAPEILSRGESLSLHPVKTFPPADLSPSVASPRRPRPTRFTHLPDLSWRNLTITEDVVWRGEVLIEGYLEIAPQATVTVAPGTTVRFRPTERGEEGILLVRGRLQAVGSRERKITFTSDEINPSPGDWQGIVILDSGKKNLLEWCRIEAATTGVEARFSDVTVRETDVARCRTGLALRSSAALVTGGGITDCGTGLISSLGDTDVTGARFSGNRRGIALSGGSLFLSASEVTTSEGSAVEATGARLRLEGSRFARNGAGVVVTECRGDLVGNRIDENRTVGLDLAGSPLRVTGNRLAGNGEGGVVIRSGGGTLWDNSLGGNGGFELINAGPEDVVAPDNWWGSADPGGVRGRIREGCGAGPCGKVIYLPIRTTPLVPLP